MNVPSAIGRHPLGLWTILATEFWERFSYYGMRALLMVYMVQALGFEVIRAGQVYGLYTGLAYMTPMLGGIIADRVLGQRAAIAMGAALMALGHTVMILDGLWAFYLALILLILGTGLFKANTAVLLGQQYAPNDPKQAHGFNLFYMTVNVGAFLAPLVCGFLAQDNHWDRGFGLAGFGMLLGLIIFLAGQKTLAAHLEHQAKPSWATHEDGGGKALPAPLPQRPQPLQAFERRRILGLVVLAFVGNVSIWTALGQAGSSLALFAARDINLHIAFLSMTVPPSALQSANPLFIILGVPVMGQVWRTLARRGLEPTAPVKFVFGLSLAALGFFILTLAGVRVDGGDKVSMLWLIVAVLFNTLGELCIAPVGLALVSRLAPKAYASLLMGVWYASIAVANTLGGQFAGLYEAMTRRNLFMLPMLMCATMALLLLFISRKVGRLLKEELA